MYKLLSLVRMVHKGGDAVNAEPLGVEDAAVLGVDRVGGRGREGMGVCDYTDVLGFRTVRGCQKECSSSSNLCAASRRGTCHTFMVYLWI